MPVTNPFSQGNEISLRYVPYVEPTFLWGRNSDHLAAQTHHDKPASGTRWRCHGNHDGTFRLLCLDPSAGKLCLRGHPQNGTVDLGGPADAGVNWAVEEVDGLFELRCTSAGDHIWLLINDGLRLAADRGEPPTSQWEVTSFGILID